MTATLQLLDSVITSYSIHYTKLYEILDIGAGLGDIAYIAFPQKTAVLLDINKATGRDFPLSEKHSRITSDFFDYKPTQKFNTLLISHSLQFIDEDFEKLRITSYNVCYTKLLRNIDDGISS